MPEHSDPPALRLDALFRGELDLETVRRTLSESHGFALEYELAYQPHAPAAGTFALDLTYADREVRRTAKLARDGRLESPFFERSRARPLPVAAGLDVREGRRGSFTFLLDVPPEIYQAVLSQPVDFALKLFELTHIYYGSAKHILRIARGQQSAEIDLPVAPHEEAAPSGETAGLTPVMPRELVEDAISYRITQRLTQQSDGTTIEMIEEIERWSR